MNILFVTSEIAPWVKTGGLGDVSAALPLALRAQGVDVRVLVPRYPALAEAFPEATESARLAEPGGLLPPATILATTSAEGLPLYLLDCPELFMRQGNPYLGPEGLDWLDNHLRFGLLSRAAAWCVGDAAPLGLRFDVLHCNDWQSALAPAYLHYGGPHGAGTLMTIHNLSFQGLFGRQTLQELGLPADAWQMQGVEFYGHLSFMKSGLQFADLITTVSPTYAREIQTPAQGYGLDGLLRHRTQNVHGILNGIDGEWNPACDPHLVAAYDSEHLEVKLINRKALRIEMGLEIAEDQPLLAMVSRLTEQKGVDLVLAIVETLLAQPAQLVVLGSGMRSLETALRHLAERYPGRVAVRLGFDEALAHRIEAGADIFLMPSRFEPCGLNQMYSLRYGTPPVVRATGGLADTVQDEVNGFSFAEPSAQAFLAAVQRACAAWHDGARWRQIQLAGMSCDYGWQAPARRYAELYQKIIERRASC